MIRTVSLLTGVLVLFPMYAVAQTVPESYRDEIRAVLLAGDIGEDVDVEEFEAFVDTLSDKAYNANVTGADLTEARVEALLGAAAVGFEASGSGNAAREPNVGVLWGTVALLIIIAIIARYWRRMHNGGALGHT